MGGFHILVPARLASTRLPNKPLADIGGQAMIVRVAQQAALSNAKSVHVACDDEAIARACESANIRFVMTRKDHVSGTDRLAEAAEKLGFLDNNIVVNVQGDEPFVEPMLVNQVANLLEADADAVMSTAAHAITDADELANPNIVKVVVDAKSNALYFSRACIPYNRDGATSNHAPVLRHMGLYGYRAGFLKQFTSLAPSPLEQAEVLEQLRALWHGYSIKVAIATSASPPGVDTPDDLVAAQQEWIRRN
jgi:3-deoxy-manno-octulosonate cytidylyltransferase (CMP-KDO synthetase)